MAELKTDIKYALQGSTLTCPSAGFQVQTPIPKGYLDGLTCQGTDAGGAIVQIPLSQVVQVAKKDSLPGGAIFGIVLAVLVGLGAMAYGGWSASLSSHSVLIGNCKPCYFCFPQN